MSSVDWWNLCHLLHLDTNCIILGYSKTLHKIRIKNAILKSSFTLPITPALIAIILEIMVDLINQWRWQNHHYGRRLRWKIRKKNLFEFIWVHFFSAA
jgi:hypothetical protein